MASARDQAQAYESEQKPYGIGAVWRQCRRWFWAGAVLTWIGFVIIAGALVYVLPREYVGTVSFEIMREAQSFEVFPENSSANRREFEDHAVFIRNEVLKISSKETLYKVIEELQLVKKWEDAKSPADAFRMLSDRLQVEHHPGSSIVDITVLRADPSEAADLANAVANAYKKRRTAIETSRSNNALDMLNAQETLQEQKVEDSRQRMIELMEKFDIVDLGTQSNTVPGSDTTETSARDKVVEVAVAALKAEAEASAVKTRIDTAMNLSSEQRLEWLRQNGRLSPHGMRVLDESEKLRLQLSMIEALGGVPGEAPRQLNVLNELLAVIDDVHKNLMATELEIVEQSLENLKTIEEDERREAMKERKSYTQYVESRKAYETQSKILQAMREALLREKVDLSLPKSPIEIHQFAEPDAEPVSERGVAALRNAAITGLLWAIPGGLLLMYLAYAFSGQREIAHVYDDIDVDSVPEAVEVDSSASGEDSPY